VQFIDISRDFFLLFSEMQLHLQLMDHRKLNLMFNKMNMLEKEVRVRITSSHAESTADSRDFL